MKSPNNKNNQNQNQNQKLYLKLKDPGCRHLLLILPLLTLFIFLTISTTVTINPFSGFSQIQSFFTNPNLQPNQLPCDEWEKNQLQKKKKIDELHRQRIAICLVGGARRFELTGPSILKNLLKVYPNADLFLHSPFDNDSFKFSFLMVAPRIASVRVFKPEPIPETESQLRVLTKSDSPNGIQGLLQYFKLVEGCLTMINSYQTQNNFTYDWVVRTRVDGYWNAPLDPDNFVPGKYLVPPGSSYKGLNDRLGIGDLNSSTVALSRASLIPQLEAAGLEQLNSEGAFRAQLTTQGVGWLTNRLPFCIVSDRKYTYPPGPYDVPVASLGSKGPLSGVKCRPCKPVCVGPCVGGIMGRLYKWWSWTDWENDTLELCDAHEGWEKGWEKIFDGVSGKKLAAVRRRMKALKLKECVEDFEEMKRRAVNWDTPPLEEMCSLGLQPK